MIVAHGIPNIQDALIPGEAECTIQPHAKTRMGLVKGQAVTVLMGSSQTYIASMQPMSLYTSAETWQDDLAVFFFRKQIVEGCGSTCLKSQH